MGLATDHTFPRGDNSGKVRLVFLLLWQNIYKKQFKGGMFIWTQGSRWSICHGEEGMAEFIATGACDSITSHFCGLGNREPPLEARWALTPLPTRHLLPPARPHFLKVLKLLLTVPPGEDQVFKHRPVGPNLHPSHNPHTKLLVTSIQKAHELGASTPDSL